MSLKLAKYQTIFDTVKDDPKLKEIIKEMFIQKQIEIAKANRKQKWDCLWDILPQECEEIILSHKENMEWDYISREYGKIPATTITRWMSANGIRSNLRTDYKDAFLWCMINRKNMRYGVYEQKIHNSRHDSETKHFRKLLKGLTDDGVENTGFLYESIKHLTLNDLKKHRADELETSKKKRDAKRKAQEEKPQKPSLAVGTLIAYNDCQAYDMSYRFLIIRGETKTKYRVEEVSNQTKVEENLLHTSGYGYGGYRSTTRCPKEGQTYEKHPNISKKMLSEFATRYDDKGDHWEKVYERVYYD